MPARGRAPSSDRTTFETVYRRFAAGEVVRRGDDGTETTLRAYELIVNTSDEQERKSLVVSFGLCAAQAGYKQAFAPIVLANVGYADQSGARPLTAVYFFLEKPLGPVSPQESQSGTRR